MVYILYDTNHLKLVILGCRIVALIHFAQSQNIALQITNIKALLLQATSWMAAGFVAMSCLIHMYS